jgi:hypothetical protein
MLNDMTPVHTDVLGTILKLSEGIKLTEGVVGFTQLLSDIGPWLCCLIGFVLLMCEFESTVLSITPRHPKGHSFFLGGGGRFLVFARLSF